MRSSAYTADRNIYDGKLTPENVIKISLTSKHFFESHRSHISFRPSVSRSDLAVSLAPLVDPVDNLWPSISSPVSTETEYREAAVYLILRSTTYSTFTWDRLVVFLTIPEPPTLALGILIPNHLENLILKCRNS